MYYPLTRRVLAALDHETLMPAAGIDLGRLRLDAATLDEAEAEIRALSPDDNLAVEAASCALYDGGEHGLHAADIVAGEYLGY